MKKKAVANQKLMLDISHVRQYGQLSCCREIVPERFAFVVYFDTSPAKRACRRYSSDGDLPQLRHAL